MHTLLVMISCGTFNQRGDQKICCFWCQGPWRSHSSNAYNWELGITCEKEKIEGNLGISRLASCQLLPTDFTLLSQIPARLQFVYCTATMTLPLVLFFVFVFVFLFAFVFCFHILLCIWFPSRILLHSFRSFCFKLHLLFQSVAFLPPLLIVLLQHIQRLQARGFNTFFLVGLRKARTLCCTPKIVQCTCFFLSLFIVSGCSWKTERAESVDIKCQPSSATVNAILPQQLKMLVMTFFAATSPLERLLIPEIRNWLKSFWFVGFSLKCFPSKSISQRSTSSINDLVWDLLARSQRWRECGQKDPTQN